VLNLVLLAGWCPVCEAGIDASTRTGAQLHARTHTRLVLAVATWWWLHRLRRRAVGRASVPVRGVR